MSKIVTKSDIMHYDRCPRLTYLTHSRPDLPEEVSTAFAEQGLEAEVFYMQRLSTRLGLPETTVAMSSLEGRAQETKVYLAKGGEMLLRQASFLHNEVFVALDALVVEKDSTVVQYEFKSSSVDLDKGDDLGKKALTQYLDTLIQYRTAVLSGQRIDKVVLVRLNKKALSPDWDNFFHEKDITDFCRSYIDAPELLASIEETKKAAFSAEDVPCDVGGHCKRTETSAYLCPFYKVCHEPLPKDGVHTIYRLMPATRKKLKDAGITTIGEIPASFPLTGVALKQRQAAVSGQPFLDRKALRDNLKLPGPIAFIDFETVNSALPKVDGYGPWSQILTQASVHITDEQGKITKHHEWLASRQSIKEATLAKEAASFLAGALEGCQTVVSYNKTFELTRMKELAERVPSFLPVYEHVVSVMVDLLKVVENSYYHMDFGGSLSIKKVLPVLVPDMSYEGMEVSNGLEAMETGLKLLFSDHSPEETSAMRAFMLNYCRLDTLAMVEIVRSLKFLLDEEGDGGE